MKSDRQKPVAIVGGGFSGTMVAAQLARKGIETILIEGGCRAGRGIAYSTTEPAHVLRAAMHRDHVGLRAGGFGILIARQIVDELVYNERGNEVLLIRHLS